jgi:multidrug efflux pump subunit AcrA (membrane-fusion protein)
VVHRSALLTRDGRSFVLKVEDGVVRYVTVRVGVTDDERVELLSGVAPGDTVIRGEATTRLADGARVGAPPDGARAANELVEPTS